MGTLPSAKTSVAEVVLAAASGLDTICIWSPVATHDDLTPRIFGDAAAALAYHGYCEGVEYAALHKKPFAFVGMPIATPGVIGREDVSGNTGSSATTLVAGASGVLGEHDGILGVEKGGTVGTDQIILTLSLDGGRKTKRVRLGTATSYAIPYFGVTVNLTVGTLVAGDTIHTWHGTAPRAASASWVAAREAMASELKDYRSVMVIGDLQSSTESNALRDVLNTYQSTDDRFLYARASVRDRLPVATMSAVRVSAAGTYNTTFAEVGATGDTITRSAGSFVTDGFLATDFVTVAGSASNNFARAKLGAGGVAALVLTLDTQDLAAEGPIAGVVITAVGRLTFASGAKTITRTRGSWLSDGFRVGDLVTITDTVSNNITSEAVTVLTATVMTLGAATLVDETIAADVPTVSAGQTKAEWMAAIDAAFAATDGYRIDLSAGRGRVTSPITDWYMRRPAGWAASAREYQHDLQRATWRKDDGPIGFDLFDEGGHLVEWDDRVDGGAGCLARFTTFRTWGNGPVGAFIALSLTRHDENSLLSETHNVAVVNLACTIAQRMGENCVGRDLDLNDDGTATDSERSTIENQVNKALDLALCTDTKGEGKRASSAVWTASKTDVLNRPGATLTGSVALNLKGTIHNVDTVVRVKSSGQ